MSTSPVKKHVTILAFTITLCAIGLVGLWRFTVMMQAKKNKVLAAKEQLASYEQNKKIFSEESAALAAIGTRIVALESYLVTNTTTPQLLSSLEALGQKSGVEFTITSVQTPGTVGANQKLVIDFSAKGSALHMDTFFEALSHQSYQVKFTKFSLFADGVSQSNQLVTPTTEKAPTVSTPQWGALASIEVISF